MGSVTDTGEHWVFQDGEFKPEEEARLPVHVQALHYGTGVFEGLRAYPSLESGHLQLLLAHEHYRRMHESARLLRLSLPWDVDQLVSITAELLRRNQASTSTYIRPIAYKLAPGPGVPFGVRLGGITTGFTMTTMPLPGHPDSPGIRCAVSSWRRFPDTSLPVRAKITGGYVNNALGVDEAVGAGYDDAVFLNHHGHVAEAGTSNIFLVRDGRVLTPGPDADILQGITRSAVMEILGERLGVAVQERPVTRSELYHAGEIFLTGTGCEIVPVVGIDGHTVGDGVPGKITSRVRAIYQRAVRGQDPGFQHWLTDVHSAAAATANRPVGATGGAVSLP